MRTAHPAKEADKVTKAFDKIAAGLADAIAYAQGDTTRGRVAAGPQGKIER